MGIHTTSPILHEENDMLGGDNSPTASNTNNEQSKILKCHHVSVGMALLPDPHVLTGLPLGCPYAFQLSPPKALWLPPHPSTLPYTLTITQTSGIIVYILSAICN